MSPKAGVALALALICGVFVYVAEPRINSGGPDIGALQIGTPDEHEIARGIWRMYEERTLDYRIPAYGGFYPNLAFLIAKPILRHQQHNKKADQTRMERTLVLVLRWLSLAFAIATLIATYFLARLFGAPRWASLLGILLMASTPKFIYWSVRIHPDTLLLLQLVVAQLLLARALIDRKKSLVTSALVMAVIATMTKVAGAFLLPVILLVEIRLKTSWRRLCQGAAVVVAVAYMTTPRLLVSSRDFFGGLSSTVDANTTGNYGADLAGGWVEVLFSEEITGPAVTICFLVYVVALVVLVVRALRAKTVEGLETEKAAGLLPMIFAAGFLGYLVLFVGNTQPRYAMPALPTMIAATAAVLASVLPVDVRWPHPALERAPMLIVIGLCLYGAGERMRLLELDRASLQNRGSDPRLAVGTWLNQNAPDGARILYDYGTYVPLRFKAAHLVWCLHQRQVDRVRPHYIVVSDPRHALFTSKARARTDTQPGGCYHTRKRLESGELGYQVVQTFDRVTLWGDPKAQVCPPYCAEP